MASLTALARLANKFVDFTSTRLLQLTLSCIVSPGVMQSLHDPLHSAARFKNNQFGVKGNHCRGQRSSPAAMVFDPEVAHNSYLLQISI